MRSECQTESAVLKGDGLRLGLVEAHALDTRDREDRLDLKRQSLAGGVPDTQDEVLTVLRAEVSTCFRARR